MNRIGTWSFALFVGVLAYADWFAHDVPADGKVAEMPGMQVNGVKVSAACRDVLAGDVKEWHAFLELSGEGKGSVTIKLQSVQSSPEMRMLPTPVTVWTRVIEFDTEKSRTIDLGVVPAPDTRNMHSIVAEGKDGILGGGIILTSWQKPWGIEEEAPVENRK